jgi:two-component system response regulator
LVWKLPQFWTQLLAITVMHFFDPKPPEIVRVLIVEDNADDRDLLVRQLRKTKTDDHVKFISDGKAALEYLSHLPPSAPFCDLIAIFLDLRLPSMSGIEVLRRIKKLPRIKNIPVIVMTSSLDPRDFEECQRLQVASFVSKPVTFESFSKAITGLVHLPA